MKDLRGLICPGVGSVSSEMVVLTENMVLSKSKMDTLNHVKALNLWGNDLTDVSLLHRMPNVEVVSLSINRISSLKDFQYCK